MKDDENRNEKTVVTILGSGTCVPSLDRSACSVLIELPGAKLLFDSGPGTMRRLLEAGITLFDISFIFYSHLHPDHTGELVNFLFSNKYPDERKRTRPLTLIAGDGFSVFFNGLRRVYGEWIELKPELFQIIELSTAWKDVRRFSGFEVASIPVNHTPLSLSYRITGSSGLSVVYSGDTDFCENLIEISKEADLFICESSLPDALKVKGHLTPSLAGEIARRANVRKLILTHFYPECDQADIEKECRGTYAGPLILSKDLMRMELQKPK